MPAIAEVLKTDNSRTTDQTLTTSSGTASGDLLLVIYGADYYTLADMGDVTSSAGTPTLVGTSDGGDLYMHLKVYTVSVGSSGAKTVTIPAAINCDIHGVVLRITGTSGVDAFGANNWGGSVSSANAVAPSVSAAASGELLVCAWMQKSGDFPNVYTVPGSMTKQAETVADPFSDMAVASEDLASSGATGTRTATWPSLTQWAAVSIALASAGNAVSGDVTATTTASVTATGANAAAGAASPTITASTTATGANAAAGAATSTATATVTATGANAAAGDVTASTTAGVTATGANAAVGAATASTTTSVTATATVTGTEAVATTEAVVTATAEVTHAAATGGSWYSLLDITREAASIRAAERSRRPVACPNDGEPLQSHRGVLHCPFDGWTDEGG